MAAQLAAHSVVVAKVEVVEVVAHTDLLLQWAELQVAPARPAMFLGNGTSTYMVELGDSYRHLRSVSQEKPFDSPLWQQPAQKCMLTTAANAATC